MQPIENKVINRIYGNDRGRAFSKKDFAALGQGDSLDKSLARLAEKGKIRRLARGLYDYPNQEGQCRLIVFCSAECLVRKT